MSWIETHVKTTAKHADAVSDQLEILGAQAVTFQDSGDQPIFEPTADTARIWPHTTVIGLFDTEQPMDKIILFLEKQQAKGIIENFHLHHLEDQDWQRLCLESFKPMQFGKRVWICPSWHTPPEPQAVNIVLDPGLAFGTGTHPTTALCLEWLDQHINGDEEWIIDYGCGSGILAIAALKLGVKHAFAIDHDPEALKATQENGLRNGLSEERLTTALPEHLKIRQVDVVVANILANPLINLAPTLAELVKPNGQIILSGVLIEQAVAVKEAYQPWFDMQSPSSLGEWVRLSGTKKKGV